MLKFIFSIFTGVSGNSIVSGLMFALSLGILRLAAGLITRMFSAVAFPEYPFKSATISIFV